MKIIVAVKKWINKIFSKIKETIIKLGKKNKKTHPIKEWINFGNYIVRTQDLVSVEFLGIDLEAKEIFPRVIISFIQGEEVVEKILEFRSVSEFKQFHNALIDGLNALDYRFNDGLDDDYIETNTEIKDDRKRTPK